MLGRVLSTEGGLSHTKKLPPVQLEPLANKQEATCVTGCIDQTVLFEIQHFKLQPFRSGNFQALLVSSMPPINFIVISLHAFVKQGMGMINRYQTMVSVRLLIVYPHNMVLKNFPTHGIPLPSFFQSSTLPLLTLPLLVKLLISMTPSRQQCRTRAHSLPHPRTQLMVVLDRSSHSHPQLTVV